MKTPQGHLHLHWAIGRSRAPTLLCVPLHLSAGHSQRTLRRPPQWLGRLVRDSSEKTIKGTADELPLREGTLLVRVKASVSHPDRKRLIELDTVSRIDQRDSLENGVWLGLLAGVASLYARVAAVCDNSECPTYVVYSPWIHTRASRPRWRHVHRPGAQADPVRSSSKTHHRVVVTPGDPVDRSTIRWRGAIDVLLSARRTSGG